MNNTLSIIKDGLFIVTDLAERSTWFGKITLIPIIFILTTIITTLIIIAGFIGTVYRIVTSFLKNVIWRMFFKPLDDSTIPPGYHRNN